MIEEERILPYRTMSLTGKRVLVVAPHPDDDIIGCGGALIRHVRAGDPVRVVFLTRGDKGDFTGRFGAEYPAVREAEARDAARLIGVHDLEFLPYRDREVRPDAPLVRDLSAALSTHQAGLVYGPSPTEAHPDHRAAAKALWTAAAHCDFPIRVAFYETSAPLKPTVLVDISDIMEMKMEALHRHRSQLMDVDWSDRVRGLNRFRTITLIGQAEYAEAFWVTEPGPSLSLEKAYEDICGWAQLKESLGKSKVGSKSGLRIPLPGGALTIGYEKRGK
ncbi:MAG: PIG-L family deacetylase [Deltaproteobacteria bacterium]|nr:PIG-L family deacetylase [Deltaproteobacteria bacterium]